MRRSSGCRSKDSTESGDAGSPVSPSTEVQIDPIARNEGEIKAMRKELENLKEVLRPSALGGMFLRKQEIEERLKPVAPERSRLDR
jgi:hypothetical protein